MNNLTLSPQKISTSQSILSLFDININHITELSEGNVNQVFRILLTNDKSYVLKYAPPFAFKYQDIKINSERNSFEAELLKYLYNLSPNNFPKVHGVLLEENILLMQDLSPAVILRDELIKGVIFPNLATQINECFSSYNKPFTSNIDILNKFKNGIDELQDITKNFIFRMPFYLCSKTDVLLDDNVKAWFIENIIKNQKLMDKREYMENLYFTKQFCLIHGDLHSGSVMVTPNETFIIDPEFARVGCIEYDIGMFIANLLISQYAAKFHLKDDLPRYQIFSNWIKSTIIEIQNHARNILNKKEYEDMNSFCAIEIIRRIAAPAKVADLTTIYDIESKNEIEIKLLKLAKELILG
jgi:5-methylthioribose kinase